MQSAGRRGPIDNVRALLAIAGATLAVLALAALLLLGGGQPPFVPSPSPVSQATHRSSPAAPTPSLTPSPRPTATAAASVEPNVSPAASPTPTPVSPHADLSGLPAAADVAHRLPLAVMVDSNRRAEPQAGFNRAAIVYHGPNDGGTDRYMLVFQDQDAELVGPVRSTRLFFIGWAGEYRPALAHFGGDWRSIKRIAAIDGDLLYDIDALNGSARSFWRDKSKRAPFNAYTSTQRLRNESAAKGQPAEVSPSVSLRTFADDLPAGERPAKGSISLPYRSGAVSYEYEHSSNSYLRSLRGSPQRDENDGKRVRTRNVIVQFVPVIYDPKERYNRAFLEYVGSGRAIVFRDGLAIEATWRKDGEGELTRFLDGSGREITLLRGSTFIQVLPEKAKVQYNTGRP